MKPLQVLGKYELMEKLGAGGMAEVYKARLTGVEGFQKIVVVKKILPGYSRNQSFIDMLVAEAKLTSVLQHPNVVSIFELHHTDDNQFYMAMEYVDGQDLLKILARCAERRIRVPVEIACHIVSEICSGLHYAHNARDIYGNPLNIIHRDVSPSNIIVSTDGHVKIMDFGVAKARTEDSRGSRHVLRGKLGYMAPEQVKGEEIDHRSDLFSLGIVLFEALTLKRLFLGKTDLETLVNIREANIEKKFAKYPYLDPDIQEILRHALAREPEMRFSTALEFQNVLNDLLFRRGVRIDSTRVAAFLNMVFPQGAAPSEAPQTPRAVRAVESLAEDTADRPSLLVQNTPPPEEGPTVVERLEGYSAAPPAVSIGEATPPIDNETSPGVAEMEPIPDATLQGKNFRLQNTSGYIFGPVDYKNLVNLVQTGAVSEEEFVSINGSEWKRVREITAVRTLSPADALRARGIVPIYSGTISKTGIVRMFYQLTSRQLSGKLRCSQGSAQKEFYFYKGKPKHIASNLKQELLGPFLLHRGIVSEEQMKNALTRVGEFGGRLGDTLVSLGFVKPHDLYWLLDLQFKEKFNQIFRWSQGTYEFYEGVPCPVEMAPSDVNVYRYIIEGVRKHIHLEDLEGFLEPYLKVTYRKRQNSYVAIEQLPFNSKELRIWGKLQKYKTLGEAIQKETHNDEERNVLYQLVLVLYQLELVQFDTSSGKR